MSLDLIVRGAGSNRSPGEHLAAVLPEYPDSRLVLYGNADPESGGAWADEAVRDDAALTGLVQAAGAAQLVVYGDESLLAVGQELNPEIVWITLGSDANGVREIWRVRQQYSWLSNQRLGLIIEQTPGAPPPDTERLMRLSRAAKAMLVADGQTAPVRRGAQPASAQAVATGVTPAAEVVPAAKTVPTPVAAPETIAEPEAATAPAEVPAKVPEVPAATAEEAAATSEILAEAAARLEEAPAVNATPAAVAEAPAAEPEAPVVVPEPQAPAAKQTKQTKGADVVMSDVKTERHGEQAEQALMQRYALVKERRTTTARVAQVEATMNGLLKDIFVARFAAGPDAAASFEVMARKLTDASAEFAQLTKAMATIEQQLAKLDWVKDELEI